MVESLMIVFVTISVAGADVFLAYHFPQVAPQSLSLEPSQL